MKKLQIYFALGALFFSFIFPSFAFAQSSDRDGSNGKVIIMVVDRISWKDIRDADTPNLDRLMEKGSIGLMTTNTGGSLSQTNSYLTLGSGARVLGISGSQTAYSYGYKYRGEEIQNLMYQITGSRMTPGAIANPAIAKLHRSNANRPYRVNVGGLGTALREGGFQTAVLGNCDNYRRNEEDGGGKNYLVSMMMDDKGMVPLGDIDQSILMEDNRWPMGIRTDYDEMLVLLEQLWNKADVIAIQTGDTSRAEDFRHQIMDSRIDIHRRRALEEADKFIGKLMEDFYREGDYMMAITPVASAEEMGQNNRLTPISVLAPEMGGGWLSSGSTHREGVVTNLDVGTSILNYLEADRLPGQGGAPMISTENSRGIDELIVFNDKLVTIYNQRSFLIRSYVYALIAILVLGAISLLFKRKWIKFIKPLIIFVMIGPLLYLILPLFQKQEQYRTAIIGGSMAILFTSIICHIFRSTRSRVMAISGLTLGILIVDQWLGMRLIQASPLGYDVIGAARFYGMGNEYMGVAVGAMCTLGGAIIESSNERKRNAKGLVALMGLIVLYTMVSPNLGANVGGAIAIFGAIVVTGYMIQGKGIKVSSALVLMATIVMILAGIFFLDSLRGIDYQSHMGQTATTIRENGLRELLMIFNRKISMNIRLFKSTIWTRVFLTSLAIIVILLYRPVGVFRDVKKKHGILIKGLIGGTIGSIIALIFNDSGIVAAATATIFIAPPFVLLIMDEVQTKVMNGEWEDGIRFKA